VPLDEESSVGYFVGVVLALGISAGARVVRFDRDRAFYPTVLIVVASYYVLFAAMARSPRTILIELAGVAVFTALAIAGFRLSLWFAVAGLIAHGVFDYFHPLLITNAGVPPWWPSFCLGYDVVAGGVLAILLRWDARSARP
jgi:hypothetical protein